MAEISKNNVQKKDFWSDLPQEEFIEGMNFYQFKGFWFSPSILQGTQQVLTHFKPLPTDVILASFPKTGTTWLKAILHSILNRTTPSNHPHELVPTLELLVYQPGSDDYLKAEAETENMCTAGKRRIFSTHIPYQLFSDHTIDSSECKIVYVTRNPKDTLISMWHFVKKFHLQGAASWPLEMAVDKFCTGVSPFGPYYDHVLRYKKESCARPDKFFFCTYEDLTSDTKGEVKRLAEFLGCPFDQELEGQLLEEIVKSCSIETLKTHGINKSNDSPSWLSVPYNAFFRQSGVGDHKNYLTPGMIERIDAITKEKFHGSGFMYGI